MVRPSLASTELIRSALARSGVKSHELMAAASDGSSFAVGDRPSGYIHLFCGRYSPTAIFFYEFLRLKTETNKLKMNSRVTALAYSDERTLVSGGEDADLYIWDLRMTAKCLER